ncbi:GH3 auxin-responsive promoter family protein [Pleionea sediminis]|uniref:GH3 family domain-containing protein n=1 Tax=Pleionea sediminis TaxID=2569479 RepID=UPI0011869286|nr:GH3 auxin-responsive promoter family protein [Pleionea sediminis]
MAQIATKGFSRLANKLSKITSYAGYRRFTSAMKDVESSQTSRLKNILQSVQETKVADDYGLTGVLSLSQFKNKIPVTEYHTWSPYIEEQRSTGSSILSQSPCERYQPTSGSTSAIKWIPYSDAFLGELDQAISPWMWDLYQQFPGMSRGRHYWSLSWIPGSLREQISGNVNDDLKLLSSWKRIFMSALMTVPDEISKTQTSEQSLFASLCYLAADQSLSVISVWSPTFAINLLNGLSRFREQISETLRTGTWSIYSNELQFLKPPKSKYGANVLTEWNGEIDSIIVHLLWPSLSVISSWDTSTSAIWAEQLQKIFRGVKFQGKGLWSTEGVVTIPFQGKYPLAVNSHFYEFMDLQDDKVYTSWELKKGQIVKPLLTTGSGLLRYAMKDQIEVVDFIQQTPCFQFLGRMDGTDMVGEKLSGALASDLLAKTANKHREIKPISLVAVPSVTSEQPYYLLLCDRSETHESQADAVANELEAELNNHFHYQLARDLNQLGHARCLIVDDAWKLYEDRCRRRGMVVGNIKVEPLTLWDSEIPDAFKNARQSITEEQSKYEGSSIGIKSDIMVGA